MGKGATPREAPGNRTLIIASIKTGALSFVASWLACAILSEGFWGRPPVNAALGVTVTWVVYFLAFHRFSGLTFRECLRPVTFKGGAEDALRFVLHYGLMEAGLPAAIASPIGQLLAGAAGHVATPLFFGRRLVRKSPLS